MEEGVRWAGRGFLIQISCGLTQQSLESKVTLGSLTVLYANRAAHLASGAGLLRGYLCKSDWVRAYCHSTGRHVCIGVSHTHTHTHWHTSSYISQRLWDAMFPQNRWQTDRERKDEEEHRRKGSRVGWGKCRDYKRMTGQTGAERRGRGTRLLSDSPPSPSSPSPSIMWLVGTVLFPSLPPLLPQKLALTRWLTGGGWLELNLHRCRGPWCRQMTGNHIGMSGALSQLSPPAQASGTTH